ncbi:MAG TPA: DUF4404 family protein [Anaerolineales bacterium]
MGDEELRRKLQELHDEIENLDQVDEKGRALLRDLDDHIRNLLARSEPAESKPKPAMRRSLEDAIRHFEVTHPALTEALSDLLTALSNAGV